MYVDPFAHKYEQLIVLVCPKPILLLTQNVISDEKRIQNPIERI